MTYAERVRARLDAIASASKTANGVTRLPWTLEHHSALEHITSWMLDAGLEVSLDAAGTVVGTSRDNSGKPFLLIGSHQDSVPSSGRFDGMVAPASNFQGFASPHVQIMFIFSSYSNVAWKGDSRWFISRILRRKVSTPFRRCSGQDVMRYRKPNPRLRTGA